MEFIDFDEKNVDIAKNQPEYRTIPAKVDKKEGSITACLKLSPEELAEVNKTGVIWYKQLTFGQPMQPVNFSVVKEHFIEP